MYYFGDISFITTSIWSFTSIQGVSTHVSENERCDCSAHFEKKVQLKMAKTHRFRDMECQKKFFLKIFHNIPGSV